jgi:hypothetical protein
MYSGFQSQDSERELLRVVDNAQFIRRL